MNPNNTVQTSVPKLTFTHNGADRTLNKHPAVQLALRRGQITDADAKLKPWYLRAKIAGTEQTFVLSHQDKDAIRRAKDILNGAGEQPAAFAEFIAQREAKKGITIAALAADWSALGYPDENGRPRAPKPAARHKYFLNSALEFWGPKRAPAAADYFNEFITWKISASRRGTRAADLELNTLSCLCGWAVFARKLDKNPFTDRPTYHDPDAVNHCSDAMPESDDAVHRILAWFWNDLTDKSRVTAGAWLAWLNLTGLRPSEPFYLKRVAALNEPPHSPDRLEPGTIFPIRDGHAMRVHRRKRGQNPFVTVHTAASDFLAIWQRWLIANIPNAEYLFPSVAAPQVPLFPAREQKGILEPDTTALNDLLSQACAETKTPRCTVSGFGRAYYVRVRKSQGASNAVIAEELGQTTLGQLIRSNYGRATDHFGGQSYDWLPQLDGKPADPAWSLLKSAAASNIIAL